ncbi:uncharacterized protein LOC135391817 isoform X2 [Ornithodoros turicata]|uniref:uncharacterized protein LOC135391817 isoform X2 n=1 Tax=Ornithodoros turicata TaxID=34597 RepID=UPI003138DA86
MSTPGLSLTTPPGRCRLDEPYYNDLSPVFPSILDGIFRSPFCMIAQYLSEKSKGLLTFLYIWTAGLDGTVSQLAGAMWQMYQAFPRIFHASILVQCMCILPTVFNRLYKSLAKQNDAPPSMRRLSRVGRDSTIAAAACDNAHLVIVSAIWLVILGFMGISLLLCFIANSVMATSVADLQEVYNNSEHQYQSYRHDIEQTTRCAAQERAKLVVSSLDSVYNSCMAAIEADLQDPDVAQLNTAVLSRFFNVLPDVYNATAELHLRATILNAEGQYSQELVADILSRMSVLNDHCDDAGAAQAFCNDLRMSVLDFGNITFNIGVPDVLDHYDMVLKEHLLQGSHVLLLKEISNFRAMRRDPGLFFGVAISGAAITPAALETEGDYLYHHLHASILLGDALFFFSWVSGLLSNMYGPLTAVVTYIHMMALVQLTGMTICWVLASASALMGLFGTNEPSTVDKRHAATLMHISIFIHEVLEFQIFFICASFLFAGVIGERALCDSLRYPHDEGPMTFLRDVEQVRAEYSWATQLPDILDRCNRRLPMFEVLNGQRGEIPAGHATADTVSKIVASLQSFRYPTTSGLFAGVVSGLLSRRIITLFNETLNLPLDELEKQENESLETLAADRAVKLRSLSASLSQYAQRLPNPSNQSQQVQQDSFRSLSEGALMAASVMDALKAAAVAFNAQAGEIVSLGAASAMGVAKQQFSIAASLQERLSVSKSTLCLRGAGAKVMEQIGESMRYTLEHETGKCAFLGYTYNLTVHVLCEQIILPVNYYWVGMLTFCIGFMISMAIGFELNNVYSRLVKPALVAEP